MAIFSKSAALAALAFLAATGDAHMIMRTPVPYGKSTLNNSPLAADGSDFPCKQRTGVYDAEGASNVAAIGEPQTLSFLGSAVHGGGSCQVSLTTDLQPTKDSKWMVIKSIEGGCPASVPGNLPDDPNGTGASTFNFTIPEGIAPGDYTLAWSWLNKVGNREYYMNCAPFTVTAGVNSPSRRTAGVNSPHSRQTAKVKRQTSFPDLFVANLASINQCVTVEGFDYQYPNPGSDVQSAGTGPYTALSCGSGNGNNTAQQPTGSLPSVSGTPSSAPAFASGNAAGQSTAAPSLAPGNFASGANSVPPYPNTTSPTSADPLQVVPVTTQASAAAATQTSTAGALTGPCTDEGDWNCIDGSSFQRCASGSWSAVIPMNGMACTPGISSDFVMTAAKAKRWQA
ncbi:uncharacterized protein Z520_10223 [Fonsecaea multimorphosa CBS 102226]|uniref:Chitin-binding type-4 domain-containing protein n=1 Tax=Fonsecaea multimorphosa CBS 102226 TaxID=1442371 RepID=A0A0D2IAL3_9EURO|nr:uncharacterized protein Z520_10223 [Fonsecaea multimorphosa CBS 102226]KIX94196.1 hypothetical protein Z520_10223 [Fonsecaea multimorphosa CBS 102226]OAL19547.1 hypothetical protein AYO22_09709 [Fonsecaea multimorphosa]